MESALTICWGGQLSRLYTGYNFSSSQKYKAVIPTKVGAEKSMYGKMGVWGRISALPLLYGCSSMESAGLQNRRLGEQSLPPVPGRKSLQNFLAKGK